MLFHGQLVTVFIQITYRRDENTMRKLIVTFLLACFPWVASAQNIVLVAPSGGDFTDPVSALEAIGTTLPAATAGNRYLVKITPGRYTVLSPVVMQPFVDLEGSGTKTTILRGALGATFSTPENIQGIVNAASQSEVRDLTVKNTWSATSAIAVLVAGTRGTAITNVRAIALGSAVDSSAWKYGIMVRDSNNTRLTRVIARGKTVDSTLCQGLAVFNSNVSVSDSRMVGRGGCSIGIGLAANTGSEVQVNSSLLRGEGTINGISLTGNSSGSGETTTIRAHHSSLLGNVLEGTPGEDGVTEIFISHSRLTGSASAAPGGTPSCFSVHDEALSPLTAACIP